MGQALCESATVTAVLEVERLRIEAAVAERGRLELELQLFAAADALRLPKRQAQR
ncbi:hypothetical protein HQN90_37610 [Paenibacillus alba]|nr:hypothetical protein [Paenibacillus alba]